MPHLFGEALEVAVRIRPLPLANHDPVFGPCDQQFLKVIVDRFIVSAPLAFKNQRQPDQVSSAFSQPNEIVKPSALTDFKLATLRGAHVMSQSLSKLADWKQQARGP